MNEVITKNVSIKPLRLCRNSFLCHFEVPHTRDHTPREILMIVRIYKISPAGRYDKVSLRRYTGTFEISQKTQKALGESVSPRALFIGRRGLPGVCRGGYFMSPAGGGSRGWTSPFNRHRYKCFIHLRPFGTPPPAEDILRCLTHFMRISQKA